MKRRVNIEWAVQEILRGVARDYSALRYRNPHAFEVALNEAQAIAWESDWPHLVFPVLAEEKLGKMAAWQRRQAHIRAASMPISSLVA